MLQTQFASNKVVFTLIIVVLFSSSVSLLVVTLPKGQIENNTLCVYAIGFKRSTMLAFIYHRHSMAYDPILRVSNRD